LSRHNLWASRTLLEVCRSLTDEQLTAPAVAAYGSILETLNHLVYSEGGYLSSLGGPRTTWVEAIQDALAEHPAPWSDDEVREPIVPLDELALRLDELERLWESFLAGEEFDAERLCVLDLGTYECPAGIVMAQVFHHGSLHREQVCAMLTSLGVEPPDLQPWEFADSTGISRFLGDRTS
jgi:uncharacterized damage-inducible protein DinB